MSQKVMESEDPNYGYNALTTDHGDMIKMGVIVPLKVERIALRRYSTQAQPFSSAR